MELFQPLYIVCSTGSSKQFQFTYKKVLTQLKNHQKIYINLIEQLLGIYTKYGFILKNTELQCVQFQLQSVPLKLD